MRYSFVQIPQRLYTLDELKLNGIEAASLLSPVDTTLGAIERNLQLAAVLGGVSAWNVFSFTPQQLFYISLGLLFLWTFDLVTSSCLFRNMSSRSLISCQIRPFNHITIYSFIKRA
uniref:Uncharacterized protein n=1 Tax=Cannabis sativa TaxID=3483 RepID=A0A803R632_CANSA